MPDSLFGEPIRNRLFRFGDLHAVEEAGVHHFPGLHIGESLILYVSAGDDLDNRQAEFLRKIPVARIVRRHRHDGAGSVGGKHIVGNKNRDFPAVHGIDGVNALELYAGLVLGHLRALEVGFFRRSFAVCRDLGIICELVPPFFHERMLRRHHHVCSAEQRVGTCRINRDFVVFARLEVHFRSIRAADPVDFLRFDALDEVEVRQIIDEPVRIFGDL